MLTDVLKPKLVYLIMCFKSYSWLPKLELVRGLFRARQISTIRQFRKDFNNVNLKLLTILARKTSLDGWLDPECSSAGGYNAVLKI